MKEKSLMRTLRTEDWTTVLLGGVIVALVVGFGLAGKLSWLPTLPASLATPADAGRLVYMFVFLYVLTYAAFRFMGRETRHLLPSFAVIFAIAAGAMYITRIPAIKTLGLESVLFSVAIGLVISNFIGIPEWLRPAMQSEFFIKAGLVVLGTSVIISEILKAGLFGILQSLIVVFSVWYFAFWIARKLKIDPEMSTMLASAVSICGVSAAIATCGAIKGDNKKLSYVISLVLVVAIPMMYLMPWLARELGLSQEVAGAWLGGTIDTTGAVVASGKFLGETAEKYSVIIKSSQNVLLGLAAFLISIYWSYRGTVREEKPTVGVLWYRFPKFVLGFVLASVIFSTCFDPAVAKQMGDVANKNFREAFFAIAFVSIGLETNFRQLFSHENICFRDRTGIQYPAHPRSGLPAVRGNRRRVTVFLVRRASKRPGALPPAFCLPASTGGKVSPNHSARKRTFPRRETVHFPCSSRRTLYVSSSSMFQAYPPEGSVLRFRTGDVSPSGRSTSARSESVLKITVAARTAELSCGSPTGSSRMPSSKGRMQRCCTWLQR